MEQKSGVDSCRSLCFTTEQEPESNIDVLPGAGSGVNAMVCPGANQQGGWQAGGICYGWRIANAQLLYHRK